MPHLHVLPEMPELGRPESYYTDAAHNAENRRDREAFEAMKVGLYVTRGLESQRGWDDKLKSFEHALKHHCHASASHVSPEDVIEFYARLAHFVRQQAGIEALRLASQADDEFAARLRAGERREVVMRDARHFFHHLLPGTHRPTWMNLDDYQQMRILASEWL